MNNKIINGENLPFIIIGVVTLLLTGLGIFLMTANTPEPVSDKEKSQIIVRENSNKFGKEDSKVTLVDFSDFQCPHCAEFQPDLIKLKEEFGDQILFVYRHYPLHLGNAAAFPLGPIASDAAEAAAAQDKFWEMQNVLFENQREWSLLSSDEAIEKFISYAKEVGVEDLDKFEKETREQKYRSKIELDYNDGNKVGVTGTPSVFLNAEKQDDRSYEALSAAIKELLEK
jgi:protein-disulfide isomerase